MPQVGVGADTVERIRFYRSRSRAIVLETLMPLAFGILISLAMLITAIAQGRSRLFEIISDFSTALAILGTIGIILLFAGIAAVQVRSRVRRNLKDFYRESEYDRAEYEAFKNALEGVSIGMGMSPPTLEVLGVPTVNSMAFRERGRPGVGVTAEALKAGLPRYQKEAMMAHEVAHIALGDYFLASSSAGFEYAAHGLGVLFLMMAALVAVAVSPYLLLFLLPLAAPLAVVFANTRLRKKVKLLYRHDDLLADTIAAKLTSDPENLRKAIEELWSLSEQTRAVIPRTAHFQGYLFVTRPLEAGPVRMVTYDGSAAGASAAGAPAPGAKKDPTRIYWVPGKTESRTWSAYEAVQNRIENLRQIENGHWTELDTPDRRERARGIAGLAASALLIACVILALVVPWNGKSAWDAATARAAWNTRADV